MKRKLIGIILKLILLWPVYIICHSISQRASIRREIKHRIIAGMSREELTPIKFHKDQYQSILIHGKNEYKFEGIMYDVVELEQEGDTVIAWSWRDHKETALDRKMDLLINRLLGNSPKDQESRRHIMSIFKVFFYSEYTTIDFAQFLFIRKSIMDVMKSYHSLALQPPTPPPQNL